MRASPAAAAAAAAAASPSARQPEQPHCRRLCRAGRSPKEGFEGGQTPLRLRVPKRGFHNRCAPSPRLPFPAWPHTLPALPALSPSCPAAHPAPPYCLPQVLPHLCCAQPRHTGLLAGERAPARRAGGDDEGPEGQRRCRPPAGRRSQAAVTRRGRPARAGAPAGASRCQDAAAARREGGGAWNLHGSKQSCRQGRCLKPAAALASLVCELPA